ncbi:Hypothetical predicted protein [Mytilus galloprovincialis]|uniref:PH domain-containing protein n=1 Tax=Mytilus galloprovincialis TaxID=29158 RepID=A0A8B6CT88_MYTGA|nr:Hypothetical predicted protein [Mytilus galloprovincialis]
MKEYRFHEGCLEHKWQSSYRRLWMVMKNNVIFIFRDRPFIPENHEGTLTIDPTTKFEVRPEKANNYKFILYTGNRRRINTFKSDKKSERDLWRGYIVGVARQKVPDDLDLPRDIINKIKQDVANYHLLNGSEPPIQFDAVSQKSNTENSPRQSLISARSNPNRKSVLSDDSGVISHRSNSRSSGSGSLTIDGVGGGPVMRHKFSNHQDDTVTPSWFFEACTREKAESYLAIAAERKYEITEIVVKEREKAKENIEELKLKIDAISTLQEKVKTTHFEQLHSKSKQCIEHIESVSKDLQFCIESKRSIKATEVEDNEKNEQENLKAFVDTTDSVHKQYTKILSELENVLLEKHDVTFYISYRSIDSDIQTLVNIPEEPEEAQVPTFKDGFLYQEVKDYMESKIGYR